MKKRKSVLVYFCLVFLAISGAFTSCITEEENQDALTPNIPSAVDDLTNSRTDEQTNPYDYIGAWHNDALDYANDLSETDPELSQEDYFNALKDYVNELPGVEPVDYTFEQYQEDFFAAPGELYSPEEKVNHLIEAGIIGEQASAMLNELYVVVLGNEESTEDEVFSGIADIEQAALEADLTETEAQVVLSATSIAAHSLRYWLENAESYGGGERISDASVDFRGCGLWCKICIGIVDTLGIASGLVTVNPVTAVLGGAALSVFARCCICGTCRRVNCG
jgi:hypothetical protein